MLAIFLTLATGVGLLWGILSLAFCALIGCDDRECIRGALDVGVPMWKIATGIAFLLWFMWLLG
ncbi:hypothetical protein RZS08_41945 [Arthrospira platensis SPKY1]|nr:hypothetical protein [Arthrospira platensis SPKY1]